MIAVADYSFAPRLWPTLITLFVLPCLLALGFWQLDRADQKRVMHETFLAHQAAEPVNLNQKGTAYANPAQLYWRHAVVEGEYDQSHLYYLDNQVVDRTAGYYVYALFRPLTLQSKLLVNLGWMEAGMDRSRLPTIALPKKTVVLEGVIKTAPSTGIFLGDAPMERLGNDIRTQKISTGQVAERLNQSVLPYILRLEPGTGPDLVKRWQLPGSDVNKHLGYAFQWFALAATLLIIYLIVNTHRRA